LEDDDYEYEYEDIKVGNISIHQNSGQRQHKPTGNPAKHHCGYKNIDCQVGNGAAYRGVVSQTLSGLKCQAWNVQTPHKHEYGNLGHHNQCRNPDGSVDGVWCYTTNTNKRWELCKVGKCSDCHNECGMKNVDCQVGNGADYRGGVSQTMSGLKCQAWNVQTPHKHEYGNHYNHHKCRHADDTVGVWCYTTTSKRWELCDVRKCSDCDKECGIENVDCQVGKGGDYRGGVSQTVSGRTCQAWNVQTPHKQKIGKIGKVGNHNQCRNPTARAGDGAGVWCYTTDPDKRWELCDVPKCSNCKKEKGAKPISEIDGEPSP